MKPRLRIPVLLIYVLVLLVGMYFLTDVLSDMNRSDLEYSEIKQLFYNEQVKNLKTKDGILWLELHEPYKGESELEYELPSFAVFYEDLNELIVEQYNEGKDGVLESYDYLPNTQASWLETMLPYILMLVITIVLFFFLSSRAANGGGGAGARFTKPNVRTVPEGQKVTFADVAGADEEKAELQEVVDFLRNPQKYTDMGAKIPKGVLLVGPPGTGKTLLARAVAGEAGVEFLSISGSDFVELYVGVGASRVRELFEQAKKVAPAIIFIDEIDAVGRRRGAGLGGGHDEKEQTLNQLLVEMDGFTKNEGVIILAATNRADILDPALTRPGRFDRQVYVGEPDVKGREAVLKVHAANKRFADDVDFKVIARATAGFTGADLANLLNEAALLATRKDHPVILMPDLEEAILKVIAGPEKKSHEVSAYDRHLFAVHEAGHALAHYFLPTQDPVTRITVIPRGNAAGLTISMPDHDSDSLSRNKMYERIIVLLGGRVAEQICLDDISTGASSDLERATAVARDMVARYGMSKRIGPVCFESNDEVFIGRDYGRTKNYSERTAGDIDDEIKALLEKAYEQCVNLLTENRAKLDEVAAYVEKNLNMNRAQFEACMEGKPIPEDEESIFARFEEKSE